MSDANKPIYKLSVSAISAIAVALHNPGKQWVLPSFELGDFPVVQTSLGRLMPPVPYVRHVKKTGTIIEQTLHVYELADGTFLLTNPVYKYRKVNGVMTRAKTEVQMVVPSNALSVYVVRVIYPEDDFTVDNLTLEITERTNEPLRHLEKIKDAA